MIGASISSDLIGLNSFDRLILRLSEIDNYKLVFKYLLINEKFIISLLIFIFCIYKNFKKNKLLYSFVITNALLYYILLYMIYFQTPADLYWHLNSSATRVMPSIAMVLVFFSISTIIKDQRIRKENLI